MPDTVQLIGRSTVQHGPLNNRIYVMNLVREDIPGILRPLDELAGREGYTKIFVKAPQSSVPVFERSGYIIEATVPGYFNGREAASFMAKYPSPLRKRVDDPSAIADVLSTAFRCAEKTHVPRLLPGFTPPRPARRGDAGEIAALLGSVLATYPFPVSDPEYIARTLNDGIRYYCIRHSGRIAAVASCEINDDAENAEMTDFGTRTEFQGKGLAACLLHAMEADIAREGIRLAYTIARARSYPVNVVFARAGFRFGGTLPNNTNIGGAIESMNVWYKKLQDTTEHEKAAGSASRKEGKQPWKRISCMPS